MNDIVLIYTITLAFVCVITGLLLVYRYYLGNRLIDQAAKLKSQMAKLRQDFPELGEIRGKAVAGAIGEIGINGILSELGIDPSIINNPLVKGLIDKYAPRLIDQLGKKTATDKEDKSQWL